MTQFSNQMRKKGMINTQMALNVVEKITGRHYKDFGPTREWITERKDFILRMRAEVPCEKTGTGKGAFWYFNKAALESFAEKIKKEA